MADILFVDDEQPILHALKRVFRNYEDWTYHFANSPKEALEILVQHNITVLVCDHKMPQMEGAEFLSRVKEKRPNTVRIMLTGHANLEAVQQAVNSGEIFRFILKPWDDKELRLAVKQAVEYHTVTTENKRLTELTKKQNEELKELNKNLEEKVRVRTKQVSDALYTAQELNRQLEETLFSSTRALANMIQMACPEVGSHSRRVAKHAKALGNAVGLNEKECNKLEIAALLHDNGKLGIPPFLIEKSPKDYSPEEMEIYQTHPIIGAQNLESVKGYEDICQFIHAHHEKYDGTGFPGELKGADIPIEAFIIGIADKYDNLMTIPHPNKEYVFQRTFQVIADSADTEYPEKLVQTTLDYITSIKEENTKTDDSMYIGLSDMAPGMLLAKDIYSMSGSLLLAGGSTLTKQNIKLIRSIARVDPIAGKICIASKGRYATVR